MLVTKVCYIREATTAAADYKHSENKSIIFSTISTVKYTLREKSKVFLKKTSLMRGYNISILREKRFVRV